MVAVTCRTEYLTTRHEWGARGAWVTLLAGLLTLVVLRIVDVAPTTISFVVFAAVALSLAIAAWGRLGARGAILLSVDDDTVNLGNEGDRLASYPRTALRSLSTEGPATATSTSGRNLTVAGLKYLVLEFAADSTPGGSPSARPDELTDLWQVAVVESDAAASVVIDRLRPAKAATSTAKVRVDKRARAGAHSATAGARSFAATGPTTAPAAADDPVPAGTGYDAPRIANAGSDEAARRLWESATGRHDEILRDYGAYELQPELMLRYPAVTDITLEPVQNFHDALSDAQALRTETYPGARDVADTYQQKVKALSRAWIACESNGRRLGTTYLGPDEQDGLDTALKLVNHARGGATPQEQAAYYQRAHRIVAELRDQGGIHPPIGAVAQLEASARRALR